MCAVHAKQGNSSRIRAQGIQNRRQKNRIKNWCVQSMRKCGTSAGFVPKAYKTAARKTFNITFGMHEKLMCPVHAKQGNSRRIRAQGRQNRSHKDPLTSLLECIKNRCVQCMRNSGTSAGLVPKAYKTAARKTLNITFGMYEKVMCPVHAKQGNSRRIRAQGRQNRRLKNPLTSLLECIKNWCVQCMRNRGIVAGFVPKADKTAARKTLYHHLWNAYEILWIKRPMCPVHAEQGNSSRIRAQGIQNRRQKKPLTSLLECINNWCVQCMPKSTEALELAERHLSDHVSQTSARPPLARRRRILYVERERPASERPASFIPLFSIINI